MNNPTEEYRAKLAKRAEEIARTADFYHDSALEVLRRNEDGQAQVYATLALQLETRVARLERLAAR